MKKCELEKGAHYRVKARYNELEWVGFYNGGLMQVSVLGKMRLDSILIGPKIEDLNDQTLFEEITE